MFALCLHVWYDMTLFNYSTYRRDRACPCPVAHLSRAFGQGQALSLPIVTLRVSLHAVQGSKKLWHCAKSLPQKILSCARRPRKYIDSIHHIRDSLTT